MNNTTDKLTWSGTAIKSATNSAVNVDIIFPK